MELLRELYELIEGGGKKKLKKLAAQVYHRDYLKTRRKPYRKYDPAEYAADKAKGSE